MHIPVHSPCLAGCIDVVQTVLIILTMAGLFLDRRCIFKVSFRIVLWTPLDYPGTSSLKSSIWLHLQGLHQYLLFLILSKFINIDNAGDFLRVWGKSVQQHLAFYVTFALT